MSLERAATIDDLLNCPEDGRKYELVDGQIVVTAAGYPHARIVVKIVHIIATFLDTHPIAEVFADNLGIRFPNGNLRLPDVTVVRKEKLPKDKNAKGFPDFIPDLAVEVMSPSDSLTYLGLKIGEFLECGVPLVWVVDPARESVTVYRSLSDIEQLTSEDFITAEDILPGFSCKVSRFFEPIGS
jgi:Uma2 family endonuclease